MNHKINRLLGIVTGAAGGLLLIIVAVLMIRGSRFSDIFDFADFFPTSAAAPTGDVRPTVPDPTVPAPTQATEPVTASVPDETVPTTTEPPEVRYSTKLRVGVSRLDGNFDPFADLSEGDEDVMKLVGINLLTRDRAGKVILMATEGEYSYYNDQRYLYTGPADISVEYDAEKDETTYTLKLRDGIFFSDGVKLTVDDLIFNLYVRLQPNFTGSGNLRSYDIVGLKNYYYNNSLAENIVISDEDVQAELDDPGEEISGYIRNLIVTILRDEAKTSQDIWANYKTLGYGDSAQEFFYNLYGLDLNYNLKIKQGDELVDKPMDEVCDYVIESYGLDYHLLAEHYAVDRNYFDKQITDYTRETLLNKRIREEGGEPVDYISGIVRIGEYTVKLRMRGYNSDALYEFFDMIIAPLHYYGDPLQYDYESHKFGFARGKYEIPEKAKANPLGAGPYVFVSYDGYAVYLKKNENYYKQTSDIEYLSIRAYSDNVTEQIRNNELDIVVLDGSREINEELCAINENGRLCGDTLYVEEIPELGYSYIGINADRVKVGDDPDSTQSRALRTAILTAMSAFKEVSYVGDQGYFGSSVDLVEYPVSPFFSMEPDSSSYSKAYNQDPDGNALPKAADDMERLQLILPVVRQYLELAGYTYNENSGKFTGAPSGASMRYEIMIKGSIQDDHPSYTVLSYAKSVLYQLGISLDIRYVSSAENMLVYLYSGDADMWCATWDCVGDPNFDLHYASTSKTNLYHVNDPELDGMIEAFKRLNESEDQAAAKACAVQIMNRVREWAVELPCYTSLDYLVYNVKSIDVSTLPNGHSQYWTWMDDVAFLDVYPQVVED